MWRGTGTVAKIFWAARVQRLPLLLGCRHCIWQWLHQWCFLRCTVCDPVLDSKKSTRKFLHTILTTATMLPLLLLLRSLCPCFLFCSNRSWPRWLLSRWSTTPMDILGTYTHRPWYWNTSISIWAPGITTVSTSNKLVYWYNTQALRVLWSC